MLASSITHKACTLQYKVCNPLIGDRFPLPAYATQGSAGLDLRACIEEPLCLNPNEVKLIPTGLAIHIQNPDLAGLILPRSGLGHKGLVLGNLIGLIDSDYQGELKISMWNRSNTAAEIAPGDRIAQLILIPICHPVWHSVTEFTHSTRGENGFGHSGVR